MPGAKASHARQPGAGAKARARRKEAIKGQSWGHSLSQKARAKAIATKPKPVPKLASGLKAKLNRISEAKPETWLKPKPQSVNKGESHKKV